MTKSITFRIIKGTRDRINAETGVVIRKSEPDNGDGTYYYVLAPTRDGFDIITTERTLVAAREWATERVELMREVIAEAYDEALASLRSDIEDAAEQVATGEPSRTASALVYACRRSWISGFPGAAARRLSLLRAHLRRTAPLPTDAEIAEAFAAAQERFVAGTRIRARGELAYSDVPFVAAESGRVCVPFRLAAGGHGIAYVEDVEIV